MLDLQYIVRALAAMPGQVGEALYLRRVEGLSLNELGRVLRTSLATTKRRLKQGQDCLDVLRHADADAVALTK